MPGQTRIEAGRRRAKAAKRALGLTSAAGFAVALALARQGHPAAGGPTTSSSTSGVDGSTASSSRSHESDDHGSTLQGGSLASPSGGSPPVATHTS
jgi:hypothetical protein